MPIRVTTKPGEPIGTREPQAFGLQRTEEGTRGSKVYEGKVPIHDLHRLRTRTWVKEVTKLDTT